MKNSTSALDSPRRLRQHSSALVLQQISAAAGPVSRTQVAQALGLTEAAISRITRKLLDAGLIREGNKFGPSSRPGRRSVELELAADGAYVLGFGAGGFEQWIQLANLRGECIARRRLHILRDKDPKRVVDSVTRQAISLVRTSKIEQERLLGMGIAIAGVVDEKGTVLRSPNLGWGEVPLGEMFGRTLQIPIYVESLHHALLVEWRLGSSRGGIRNIVVVNCALGIGASVMVDGRLIRGGTRAAGQIGHMRVPGASNLCTCGRRGCLDTVASGHAVLTQLGLIPERIVPKEHDEKAPDLLLEVIKKEAAGDIAAKAAFRAAGEQLGWALNAVWALADPEMIVLAGPFAHTQSYVEGIRATFAAAVPDSLDRGPSLVVSTDAVDAAAVWLALGEFVFDRGVDLRRLELSDHGPSLLFG